MLPVGIKREDVLCALGQRILDSGLQGRPLSEIHGVAQDRRSRSQCFFGRTIGRAVIHHHDARSDLAHSAHYLPQHFRFLIRGNDHPRLFYDFGHAASLSGCIGVSRASWRTIVVIACSCCLKRK